MKTDNEMIEYFDTWKRGELDIEAFMQIIIEQETEFLADSFNLLAKDKQIHEMNLQMAQKRLRAVREMRAKLKYLEELT
jgi:hypothetical protein